MFCFVLCVCAVLVCSSAGDSPGFFFYLFVFILFCFCFFVNDSDKKEEEAAPDWDDPEFVKEQEYLFAVFIYENGLPFNPFNSKSWKKWTKKVLPKMKVIGRDRLAGSLLDAVASDTDAIVVKVMFCLYFFLCFFLCLHCLFINIYFVYIYNIGSFKW